MPSNITDRITLNNGVQMPWLGLGVWQADDPAELDLAVKAAVRAGYRSFDTADVYNNEQGVGRALRECGVPCGQLFVTTKLRNARMREGYDACLRAFDASLERLGMEYVDLYLIHWPVKEKYRDGWRALIRLHEEGRVRAIGVSNFKIHHLEDILATCGVVPAVNQVEMHPWLTQKPTLEYCRARGIQAEAYSPLMTGHLNELTGLGEIARRHGKTPAQVVLRWDLQNGVIVIPKSVHEQRIIENAQIFDFELSAEEMAAIDGMDRGVRFLPDPDNI